METFSLITTNILNTKTLTTNEHKYTRKIKIFIVLKIIYKAYL